MPVEGEHGNEIGGEHPLVVDRAATIQVPARNASSKRVARPVLAFHAYDIHMRKEHYWAACAVATNSRNQRRTTRRWLQQPRLNAFRLEHTLEVPCERKLVAGRIGSIEL